jgi:enoyl-CoA hydratase
MTMHPGEATNAPARALDPISRGAQMPTHASSPLYAVQSAHRCASDTTEHKGLRNMEFIQYDVVEQVAVVTLDRPDKANAQHRPLLVELNEAFDAAAADEDVRVLLLQASGKHFSAGHDLTGGPMTASSRDASSDRPYTMADMYAGEAEVFLGYSMAWRNFPKPSIAAVQGKCVAAGLMLCWPCDLIIAADNAEFSDPTARMGLAGVEYMAHAWEFGPRKAKELLFRSTAITADEARDLGMVNKVVPLEELRSEAMAWARDIATLEPIMTRLIKRGINATQDAQGFSASLAHSFDIHELAHGIMASMRVANPDADAPNILEHMRATNKAIAGRDAEPAGVAR